MAHRENGEKNKVLTNLICLSCRWPEGVQGGMVPMQLEEKPWQAALNLIPNQIVTFRLFRLPASFFLKKQNLSTSKIRYKMCTTLVIERKSTIQRVPLNAVYFFHSFHPCIGHLVTAVVTPTFNVGVFTAVAHQLC